MAGVTEDQCVKAQRLCAEKQILIIEREIGKALSPLGRIEAQLEAIASRMDGLTTLYGRVSVLEVWKANLNGQAKALSEHGPVTEVRTHIEETVKAATDNMILVLQTRKEDVFNIPKKYWMPLAALGILMLALAMVAGEKGLSFLPNMGKPAIEKELR